MYTSGFPQARGASQSQASLPCRLSPLPSLVAPSIAPAPYASSPGVYSWALPLLVTQDRHPLSPLSPLPPPLSLFATSTRDLPVKSCLRDGSRVTFPLGTLILLKAFFPPDIQALPQSLDCAGFCVVAVFAPRAPFCILLFSTMLTVYALQTAGCLCAQGFAPALHFLLECSPQIITRVD